MRIPAAAALTLVLALGACGGGSDEPPKSKDEVSTKAAKTTPKPIATTPAAPKGTAAPQALSSFRCARDTKGRWNAVAVVLNDTKKPQTYQITVHVGPAEGSASPARTQSVGRINAGGSVTVRVLKIPGKTTTGPCQVQLLATAA